MGGASPVSKIKLAYGPWSSKNSIDRNRLKKFLQVGIDVKCMHTSFGGCGLSGFRDIATFQKQPNFPFRAWTIYSPWSSKNLIDWNRLKKFTQVGIDVKCMHTDFGGCGLSGFGDKISLWSMKVEKFNLSESAQKIHASRDQYQVHAHQFWWVWSLRFQRYCYLSKTAKFPFWGMDYSPCHRKINQSESAQKIHASRGQCHVHVHQFGGRGLSSFGDMATFQKWPNFPFGAWTIVHGHQKIQSIGIGSKNLCK